MLNCPNKNSLAEELLTGKVENLVDTWWNSIKNCTQGGGWRSKKEIRHWLSELKSIDNRIKKHQRCQGWSHQQKEVLLSHKLLEYTNEY